MTWSDNTDREDRFEIERCTGTAAFCAANQDFSRVAFVGANVRTYSNSGLSSNTTYTYRVRAVTDFGDSSPYSNTDDATTTSVLPVAPSNLIATPGKNGSTVWVSLAWTDDSNNETGFKIERRRPGGTFVQIATVSASTTTYRDSTVARRTAYEYRVRATNLLGDSDYSNLAAATTK